MILSLSLTHARTHTRTLTLTRTHIQGVVNSVFGLTTLGAKWADLRADLRAALQQALLRVSEDMGEQGVAVSILSLAKLEVGRWWVDRLLI